MTWSSYHTRGEILSAVIKTADQRQDGRLPMDVEGVSAKFDGEFDLLTTLQLKWHTRLAGNLERQLSEQPMDLRAAAIAAWHATAAEMPGVRAVVLTHTGGTFCAGADLGEVSDNPAEAAAERTREMTALLRAFLELPKPVVGVIDGHVRAGGMGLVGACDIVVAGPRSTFALTEVRLGLAASIISLTVLPRLSQRAAGRYFLATGGDTENKTTRLKGQIARDRVKVEATPPGDLPGGE